MEAAKKRAAFRYKSDADDPLTDAPDEGIDEQEQEALIATLSTQDEATTAFYRKIFLGVPALGLLSLFVMACFGGETAGRSAGSVVVFYILGALSLLVSLVMAYRIPVSRAENARDGLNVSALLSAWRVKVPAEYEAVLNKLLDHLVLVNAALCAIVCVVVTWSGGKAWDSVGLSAIPVLLGFAVVAIAKHELRPVDIPSLERLKYTYKGA